MGSRNPLMPPETTTYRRIEAVKLAACILRHLSGQRGPVSGRDVATALDQPHATVMCHLATLADEGLVRSAGGCWELGMGLALFWARYKAAAQGKIDRLNKELSQLEV
jgi:DNA-binding IclR family transcriptional regulator